MSNDITTLEQIITGLQIIHNYDMDAEMAVGDDIIYCGDAELPINEEDKKHLELCNWFIDEDSWARFV